MSNPSTTQNPGSLADRAREMVARHTEGRFPGPNRQKPPVSVPAIHHKGECTNPQCGHCGIVIIPSPKATLPLTETPSITVGQWSVYTRKRPILLLPELDELGSRYDFPLPEMIFGHNFVELVNEATHAKINFNTLDALDSLHGVSDFKVSYHKEWLSTRPEGLKELKPYDWTYLTNYKGSTSMTFVETHEKIPLQKLLRPDPILFYDESVLFEDELGDNGIAMLLTKIRVMHSCLLLLCRFFLRVDDVALRIRDTRVYVDLETNEVLREYKTQDVGYAELLAKVRGTDPKKMLRDANWVSSKIDVGFEQTERAE